MSKSLRIIKPTNYLGFLSVVDHSKCFVLSCTCHPVSDACHLSGLMCSQCLSSLASVQSSINHLRSEADRSVSRSNSDLFNSSLCAWHGAIIQQSVWVIILGLWVGPAQRYKFIDPGQVISHLPPLSSSSRIWHQRSLTGLRGPWDLQMQVVSSEKVNSRSCTVDEKGISRKKASD